MSKAKRSKPAGALVKASSPAAMSAAERSAPFPVPPAADSPAGSAPAAWAPPSPWAGRRALPLFLILPFVVLYWCCPFFARLTLGNDYTIYSIGCQMELLYSIRHGSFPLFIPRAADGIAACGLTLGQLFHPVNWIAGLLPGYWQGHALELNTLVRFLMLGLTHYALFRFLLRLRLGAFFAFLLSFLTAYNLRMLDSLRYGASLENYTGYLLLMMAIGWHYLDPARVRTFCWMALAAYLLIVGGHPQFMYFGLLGAGILVLILPFYLGNLLPEARPDGRRYFKFCAQAYLAILVGILLATAYWLPFYQDYLRKETIRVGLNYEWSLSNPDSLAGMLNSFFNPWWSDVHGNFGGSALILLAAGLPLLLLARVRVPRVILLLWGCLVLTLTYQLGAATPVHYLFWRFVPMASSFRVPGRLAFLNPFTIMLLLAWLLRQDRVRLKWPGSGIVLPPWALLAAVMALVYACYQLLPLSGFLLKQAFYPAGLHLNKDYAVSNRIPPVMFVVTFLAGLLSLLLLCGLGLGSRWRRSLAAGLCLAVAVQTVSHFRYGTWIESHKTTPTLAEMDAARKKALYCKAPFIIKGEMSRMAQEHQSRGGGRSDQLALLYPDIEAVGSLDEVYAHELGGNPWTKQALLENYTPQPAPPPARTDDQNSATLAYSSFNRLVFNVDCSRPAALALGFPYLEGRWRATLSGKPVPIHRCNGFATAVVVPPGKNTVEFRYFSPTPLIGLAVSFVVACGLVCALLAPLRGNPKKVLALALTVCFFAGLFLLLTFSLYHGQDLGTVYSVTLPAS